MPVRTATPQPASNGIPIRRGLLSPMRDSSRLLDDPRRLRARYREDGYLLLRGVLEPADVRAVRGAYFAGFPPQWFKPGTDPVDGVRSGLPAAGMERYGVPGHPAHAFVRSPVFARFAADPRLRALAEAVLDGPAILLRRKVLRHFDRGSEQASRAHVDRAYPSGAEGGDLVTLWVPLGDCPLETGGLVYLSGSHRADLTAPYRSPGRVTDRPQDRRPLSHDLNWTAGALGGRWLWADYRCGDVTMHCPDIVHASLDTATETSRLSADLRFHRANRRPHESWNADWAADDGA